MLSEQAFYLRNLRRKIIEHFNKDELQTLTFDLEVDWDELKGEEKSKKTQSLIMYLGRQGKLSNLIQLLEEERGNIEWPEVPDAQEQIEDVERVEPDKTGRIEFKELIGKIEAHMREELSASILRIYILEIVPRLDGKRKRHLLELLHELQLLYTHSYNEQLPWGIEARSRTPLNLADTDFTSADLQRINFWNQVLHQESEFVDGHLNIAPNFTAVDFSKANFSGSDLRCANLTGAVLLGSDFQKSNLSYAILREAKIFDTDFCGAYLVGVDLENVDLRKAILTGANLQQANLRMSNLSGVSLKNCDLTDANLVGATLVDVDLRDAIIENANFELANMVNAKVSPKQLEMVNSLKLASEQPTVISEEVSRQTPSSQFQIDKIDK